MAAIKPERADVVIAGCGIAGGMLACYLAEAGVKTIVLEKRPRIGIPIRCAEAAGTREELSCYLPIEERWIASDINGVRVTGPGGTVLERRIPGLAVVLRRDIFDQALADRAASLGADIRTHAEVTGLETEGAYVTGVSVFDHGRKTAYAIRAKVTVGADGIESSTGRFAGLRRHLKPADIHTCFQYLMKGDELPGDTILLFAGKSIAPGGYAWVFPRGNGCANVGLGIHPGMAGGVTAKAYLDRFVGDRFRGTRVIATVAGGTSGIKPLATMAGNGILLVGEAAGQNNPFSGGGIMNALEGATEASSVLAGCLERGDFSHAALKRYDERWKKRNGRAIAKYAKLRTFFMTLEDEDMDVIVAVLDSLHPGGMAPHAEYPELFKRAFQSTPGLLWKARKLLW
jgi:digeranylgeranylglycerophospholipid reductase